MKDKLLDESPESDQPVEGLPPRLGRRESEPHSEAIFYFMDALGEYFPQSRVLPDLDHYFEIDGHRVPIQLDVYFFNTLPESQALASYDARRYGGRVPELMINFLSRNTWRDDVGTNFDKCRLIGVPYYIIFAPYHVATEDYRPPFLRAYIRHEDDSYSFKEIRGVVAVEGKPRVEEEHLLDPTPTLPFRLGLMRMIKKTKGEPTYVLVPVHPEQAEILPRAIVKVRDQAEKAREQAEQAREQAKRERERAEQERVRAKELADRLTAYRRKFGALPDES